MVIYKITNLVNGKIYVGKKINDAADYYGSGRLIVRALRKYGKEKFKKEILQQCLEIDELNSCETFWIKKLDCVHPKGYNIGKGGEGGDTFTNHPNKETIRQHKKDAGKKMWATNLDHRQHMSEVRKALWLDKKYREDMKIARTGRKFTSATKQKISAAHTGKQKSEIHKKHLSDAWQKRKKKPVTKETLEKMSKSLKGKNANVYELEGPDKLLYRTEAGLGNFAKSHHRSCKSLKELIQGLRNEYKGWKYVRTIKE